MFIGWFGSNSSVLYIYRLRRVWAGATPLSSVHASVQRVGAPVQEYPHPTLELIVCGVQFPFTNKHYILTK